MLVFVVLVVVFGKDLLYLPIIGSIGFGGCISVFHCFCIIATSIGCSDGGIWGHSRGCGCSISCGCCDGNTSVTQ